MATLPSKKDVLLGLLEKTSVLMHLDARREDVQVPRHLKTNPQLILQLGLNLAVPIRDLDVGDDGVRCTLSFSRTPFFCVLPYPAIFAMVSEDGGRAMVWPEDVPAEVARAAEAEARKLGLLKEATEAAEADGPRLEAAPSPPKRPRPALADEPKVRVEAKRPAKPKAAAKAAAKEAQRPKRALPPYLRVIK
ncbi:MAG TPA: ClpXP protease specificity-enhancing factor SspB [Polyangiaceae bacterium]|jgi:stringent starvation protein B